MHNLRICVAVREGQEEESADGNLNKMYCNSTHIIATVDTQTGTLLRKTFYIYKP